MRRPSDEPQIAHVQAQFQLFYIDTCYKISNVSDSQCYVTRCVTCITNNVECVRKEHAVAKILRKKFY